MAAGCMRNRGNWWRKVDLKVVLLLEHFLKLNYAINFVDHNFLIKIVKKIKLKILD